MKALIRVANVKSNLKFNQLEAYRALTLSDVNTILGRYSDIDMLIFEEVQPDEITAIKSIAGKFNGKILTFGKVKLENIDNYTSLSDMQDALDSTYSLETRTYGRFRDPVLFSEVYDESGNLYVEKIEEEIKEEVAEVVTEPEIEVANTQENISITTEVSNDMFVEGTDVENDMFSDTSDTGTNSDIVGSMFDEPVETEVQDTVENDMFGDLDDTLVDVATPVVVVGETTQDTEVSEFGADLDIESTEGVSQETEVSEIGTDLSVEKTEEEQPVSSFSLDKKEDKIEEPVKEEVAEVTDRVTEDVKVEDVKQSEPVVEPSVVTKPVSTSTTKELTGEIRAIKLEPVLDLSRLDSFNALAQESKDLVNTMYNELCYYREAISKLSSEEAVHLVVEGGKGKIDTTLLDKANENIRVLEEQLKEAQKKSEEIKQLEIKIEGANVQYATLKSKYEASEQKNKELQGSLTQLQAHSSNKLSELQKELLAKKENLEKELADAQTEIERLNHQIEVYVKSTSEDRAKIDKLSKEKHSVYDNYMQALQAISTLAQKYISLFESHNAEVAKVKTTVSTYQQVLKDKVELEAKLSDLEMQKKLVENKVSETERVANLKISEFSKMQDSLKSQLEESNSKCTTLGLEIDSLNARIATAERQKQSALNQVDDLLSQISDKNTIIDSKDTMLSQLQVELKQLKDDKADAFQLQEQVQVSDLASQQLQKEIGMLQIEVKNLQDELDEKNKKIGSLARANSELKLSSQALAQSSRTNTSVALNCRYTGHAFIFPVFGSGSYGVTTTAVSLAKKLHEDGNSVLLMDLDLVSPKCNGYLRQPPLLPAEIGMNAGLQDKLAYSCMGILMHKGVDYFIHESSSLITQIAINKKTRKPFDYFSGLYTNLEVYKFVSIDWTELLNTLGNHYDYIVVDLGRFGGNSEQNSLINMFYTICLKYLVVTTKSDDDIRMMMLKLSTNKLLLDKAVWMVNMATDTKITPLMTKAFSKVRHKIVTFSGSMYGTNNLFTDALFKGQFTAIVDMLLGN